MIHLSICTAFLLSVLDNPDCIKKQQPSRKTNRMERLNSVVLISKATRTQVAHTWVEGIFSTLFGLLHRKNWGKNRALICDDTHPKPLYKNASAVRYKTTTLNKTNTTIHTTVTQNWDRSSYKLTYNEDIWKISQYAILYIPV